MTSAALLTLLEATLKLPCRATPKYLCAPESASAFAPSGAPALASIAAPAVASIAARAGATPLAVAAHAARLASAASIHKPAELVTACTRAFALCQHSGPDESQQPAAAQLHWLQTLDAVAGVTSLLHDAAQLAAVQPLYHALFAARLTAPQLGSKVPPRRACRALWSRSRLPSSRPRGLATL